MIFDTHAHYDDEAFDEDREELLESLPEEGIQFVVNVGADMKSSRESIRLAEKYPFLYAAVGIHPDNVKELTEEKFEELRDMAAGEKVVAIGESGLDFYWDSSGRALQKEWFIRQISLAKECDLPLIVHSREAAQETLDIIREKHGGTTGGVIHCYSYSRELAKEYLSMGYYIGIGGVVTFKNAKKLKEVVEYVPLERMVLETDCPYLAPVPNRGKRNNSKNLCYVAETIAQIKQIDYNEVTEVTYQNARRLYFAGKKGTRWQI